MNAELAHQANSDRLFGLKDVHLAGLSVEALRDLARNESAALRWRVAAMEKLVELKHPYANHPDLAVLAARLQVPPPVSPEPEKKEEVGAPAASVTTASLQQEEVIPGIVPTPAPSIEESVAAAESEGLKVDPEQPVQPAES